MSQFIDRRANGKNKSTLNRRRFISRFKSQIKKAVEQTVNKRGITDIEKGEKIHIPTKDINEPFFHHRKGGDNETIHPGNKEFNRGDQIDRPQENGGQGGSGSEASNEGEGLDEFAFELSREEFLEIFFEDLELPDLIKKRLQNITTYKWVRAGYSTSGIPSNISIIRTMRQAQARRMGLAAPLKAERNELIEKIKKLKKSKNKDPEQIKLLELELEELERRIQTVPFIDDIDVRFNNRIKQSKPSTQAVMFCLMDVSGSMDEAKKDIAKRFFILLYLFLKKNYEKIEVVFIRHHTLAKEVTEEDFFYSRETGGTVVSSALELMRDIINARYKPEDWNIYAAQASDGDNWNADSPYCRDLLMKEIMPFVQYFAYTEIMPRHHQSLWEAYCEVDGSFENFAMKRIDSRNEIYSVLHELFKRKAAA